jgi:uncharacterized protein YciI
MPTLLCSGGSLSGHGFGRVSRQHLTVDRAGEDPWRMAEWIYFLHPPRDNFAETMTDEERTAFVAHAQWLRRLLADGVLIVAGPTLGPVNTGILIFEAPDEEAARRIVNEEPVTRDGVARGELRPYRMGFLRGRD